MPDAAESKIVPCIFKASNAEINEARQMIDHVWEDLKNNLGEDRLHLPKKIFWLNGAPGAGKGTHTDFILKSLALGDTPIVISSLFDSPEAKRLVNSGQLVGDRETINLLLQRLIEPQYRKGPLVDGFPRSMVQVEFLKLLYQRLLDLHHAHQGLPEESNHPHPEFGIIVLYVNEGESVRRQLQRGRKIMKLNTEVDKTGQGTLQKARETDLSEEKAHHRYHTFELTTYGPLKTLCDVFPYHYIDAHSSKKDVQDNIGKNLNKNL
jgi:adenylate kinase